MEPGLELHARGVPAAGLSPARALTAGYQQLATSDDVGRDPIDEFLAEQAIAGFDYEDDEAPTELLRFLSQGSA